MKTETIKRGSIISNIVPVKEYSQTFPVGSIGQVIRLRRKSGRVVINFRDSFGATEVPLDSIKLATTVNRKVPVVGDIFVSTWGYGQSNNTWFKVKAVKRNTVTVVRVGETRKYTESMSGNAVVNPSEETGHPADKRILYDMEGNPSFKMASYARAWLVKDVNEPRFFSEWN